MIHLQLSKDGDRLYLKFGKPVDEGSYNDIKQTRYFMWHFKCFKCMNHNLSKYFVTNYISFFLRPAECKLQNNEK